jgi:hypothetical protein
MATAVGWNGYAVHAVVSPVADMQIWNARSYRFSFVISYESRVGPGFPARPGDLSEYGRHQGSRLTL